MKYLALVAVMGLAAPFGAFAHGDKGLHETCKTECPKAQNETDAMKCMADVSKKKKKDKEFQKSECLAAYKEHQHGSDDGHNH